MALNPNWPGVSLGIELVPGSGVFTELAGRAKSVSAARGRQYELAAPQSGTMNVALDDLDGDFDPTNPASPYAPNVKINRQVQLNLTVNGVVKPLWTGYVERYPQRWESGGAWQWTDLQAIDLFGLLSLTTLDCYFAEQVRNLPQLTAWFPLDEDSGATAFGDRSVNHVPAAMMVTEGIGNMTSGASLGAAGVQGKKGVSAGTPASTVTGFNNVSAIVLPNEALPPKTGPWSVTFGYEMNTSASAGTMYRVASTDGNTYIIVGTTDTGNLYHQVAVPGQPTQTANGLVIADGSPHYFTLAMAADNRTLRLSVDNGGAYVLVAPAGTTWNFTESSLGGAYARGINRVAGAAVGTFDNFMMFSGTDVYLGGLKGNTLWPAWGVAARGDDPGYRMGRIATASGVVSPPGKGLFLTTGDYSARLPAADWFGKTPTQLLIDASVAENGSIYVNGNGQIVMISRHYRENKAFQFSIGDTAVNYTYDTLALDFDSTHVANDITASQPSGVTVRAVNDDSIAAYGRRTLQLTVDVLDPAQVQDVATYYSTFYAEPQLRVTDLQVDMAGKPGNQGILVAGEVLNNCIRVLRKPAGKAPAKALVSFVEQLTLNIGVGTFMVALVLSPADFTAYLQLDHTTYGTIDTTNRLSY